MLITGCDFRPEVSANRILARRRPGSTGIGACTIYKKPSSSIAPCPVGKSESAWKPPVVSDGSVAF